MIEIIVTLGITVSSVLLFGYWFRYTCLLILSARTARDYARDVAMANQLTFLEVQAQLREQNADFDRLCAALDRDYNVVSYLLKHGDVSDGAASLEQRMLAINYRVMHACFNVSRSFSPAIARRTLDEMSVVVAYFANAMGERAAAGAAA